MANKAGLINRTLNIGIIEPELTRVAMLEQHPMAWMVEVDGFIVDARALPADLQDEARRRGLIRVRLFWRDGQNRVIRR